jgi:hypothetical protein
MPTLHTVIAEATEVNGNAIEISVPVADAIASWRRIFEGRKHSVDPRDLLRNAATELWTLLKIDGTAHPESNTVARQVAVDALAEMAAFSGIGQDDAQAILAEAFKAPTPPIMAGVEKPASAMWPVIAEDAYHGLVGDVVRTLGPHTESDPAALLIQFLIATGNAIGRGPFYQVEGDLHYTKLNAVLVGPTATGRKGTSLGRVLQIMELADADWVKYRVQTGLASGEGLIHHVRDPLFKLVDGEMKEVNRGVIDKRLFIEASEFASVLVIMGRPGNTLSPVIRDAWGLCVPKIRFCNIGGEGRRGQAVM